MSYKLLLWLKEANAMTNSIHPSIDTRTRGVESCKQAVTNHYRK